MRFLRRIFGSVTGADASKRGEDSEPMIELASHSRMNEIGDLYFDTMSRMQKAISSNNFEDAIRLIRLNLRYIPDWVRATRRQYGSLEVSTIPALQQGGTILALAGDKDGLDEMQEIVTSTTELAPWTQSVKQHQDDLLLFGAILDAVTEHPNCLQTEIKELVGEADGRRVARLISYLERAGRIIRIRKGSTYEIVLPGSQSAPSLPPKRIVGSHRKDPSTPNLREIDLSVLSYVPLAES